eukprot:12101786-Heterocapsa_arctica.AAC.1
MHKPLAVEELHDLRLHLDSAREAFHEAREELRVLRLHLGNVSKASSEHYLVHVLLVDVHKAREELGGLCLHLG